MSVPGFSERVRCKRCGATRKVVLDTDLNGRLVDVTPECVCVRRPKNTPAWRRRVDDERRRACVCQFCDKPVTGKPKVALYCEEHRAAMLARSQRKHRMKVGNKHGRAYRERNRKKLNAAARKYARKHRKERAEYKREWRKKNRDKVKMQKRRYALRGKMAEAMRRRRDAGIETRQPTRRNKRGERLCLTPDCNVVLTGRAKLCDGCKQRMAA